MLEKLLVDPISLRALSSYRIKPYFDGRVGGLSNKNQQETAHFLKAYNPRSAEESSYLKRINVLPQPSTTTDTIILDIGCGPYDCISSIPGRHIFLDDIMDAYVEQLDAIHNGLRICARSELIPLASKSVDIIYSINMIDHVDDMPETIYELHRVLKPGGRIYLQTYFNSHPLLETEPGVFDRTFLDNYILPFFEIEFIRTFAIGDPEISNSYTMDILAAVLIAKNVKVSSKLPRDRYLNANYRAPQSLISDAIKSLQSGRDCGAEMIVNISLAGGYQLQADMLDAWRDIVIKDFGSANIKLKNLLVRDQVKKNPYARIALLTLENKRISMASLELRKSVSKEDDQKGIQTKL